MRYEKNVKIENYWPKRSLQVLIRIFSDAMYILYFDFKNTIKNQDFQFLTKICEIRNKRSNPKSFK